MKRKKLTPRQKETKALDELFSEFIRKRAMTRVHGCERCKRGKKSYKELQCSHLISRWHKSTRWDEDVAVGLCGGCHMWIDHENDEKEQLLLETIGQERVELLKARKRQIGMPDINALTLYYQQLIGGNG